MRAVVPPPVFASLLVPIDAVLAIRVALPIDKAAPYVAAAYSVFAILIGLYIGIMARKLRARQREATELQALTREQLAREKEPETSGEPLGAEHRRR